MDTENTKRCSGCKENRPHEWFSRDVHTNDGMCAYCRPCKASRYKTRYQKKAKKKRREKVANWVEYKYGITPDQYDELLKSQGGVCAICGKVDTRRRAQGERQKLAVDHCHKSGRIRGLLCMRCNTGLGHFKDDLLLLSAAQRYLEHTSVQNRPAPQTVS